MMHPLNLSLCSPPDEQRLRKEIEAEQVTHPLDLYQPGSERLEKLYAAMEHQSRYQPMENV